MKPTLKKTPLEICDTKTIFKDFRDGHFCFVCIRKWQGSGPYRIILHEARIDHSTPGVIGYGNGKTWAVKPGSFLSPVRTKLQSEASKKNGKKGGRPKKVETPVGVR